jgi:hypothetical protein
MKDMIGSEKEEEEWVKNLGINFLILGPDTEDFRFVFSSQELEKSFLIFYHSFDGQYYPLIKLDDICPDLFTHQDKIIQDFLEMLRQEVLKENNQDT